MIKDYEDFKKFILSLTTIDLNAYKEKQMKRRIDTLIARHKYDGYDSYCKAIKEDTGLREEFVNYITINVSEFYRNPNLWKTLEDVILPDLISKFGPRLKVWSAACSTGDEPYSLAMVLAKKVPMRDIKIIATDLDEQVLVMALSNVGVNISALLGTLGIGGIAFALAAQDTVKNVFGAFTLLTDKPFNIGDTIRFDNFEGTVVDIGIRSTRIMNYDKRIITFPNYKITDSSIINISSEPMRRVVLNLGLTYDTTAKKMKEALELLKAIPKRVENVRSEEAHV